MGISLRIRHLGSDFFELMLHFLHVIAVSQEELSLVTIDYILNL
jgi:hypothetical protein